MLKSPLIMGEARHLTGLYDLHTATEGTRASREAKSDYREGGAGEAVTTGSFFAMVEDINQKVAKRRIQFGS